MAAKKQEPAKKPTPQKPQSPAVSPKAEVAPVHDYGEFAGSGYEETTHEDFAMPFLSLLQALSPEVSGENPVDGAKAGMLMNSVTKELYPKEGLLFVPVWRQHIFVEWKPREQGGGIVGRHEPNSEFVTDIKKKSDTFGSYKTEDENDLIETFYMFGYTLDSADSVEPKEVIVVPFTSTKIRVYKRIMQALNTFKGRPPLFANRLRITAVAEKNNHGSFFNFEIKPFKGNVGASLIPPKDEEGNTHPLILFGKSLQDQVKSGDRKMADDSVKNADGEKSDGEAPF